MRVKTALASLMCVLIWSLSAYAYDNGQELNASAPKAARQLVEEAKRLIKQDQFQAAVAALTKARSIAPNYLDAHNTYIYCKTYFLDQYDEVRTEYEGLMAREPNNPIYPMAFATGQSLSYGKAVWYKKVADLAPDWVWGHYAKAQLLKQKEPEAAIVELEQVIAIDPANEYAYDDLISTRERAGKLAEAISVAEKMAAVPEFHRAGTEQLWRLRLKLAAESEPAKASLRQELKSLAAGSRDINLLAAIRSAYDDLLGDSEQAKLIEARIHRIDPNWYVERGHGGYLGSITFSDLNYQVPLGGHQLALMHHVTGLPRTISAEERIANLQQALSRHPSPGLKRFIYQAIIYNAQEAGDMPDLEKYGAALLQIDPSDSSLMAKLAIGLANKKIDLDKALGYAAQAAQLTAEYKPPVRPANTDPSWFDFASNRSKTYQQEVYQSARSLALEANGVVLNQRGDCAAAEAKLRQALEIERSEMRLRELAEVETALGKRDEADKLLVEAKNESTESIRRQMKDFKIENARDFELEAVDGSKVKLSDLRGKVVLIDFWATWCHPCNEETPHLAKLYEKYKDKGLVVVAVSIDTKDDRYKVVAYAKEHKLEFPVVYDNGAQKAYNVSVYPTNFFIDREGKLRFRQIGFSEKLSDNLEIAINELLK